MRRLPLDRHVWHRWNAKTMAVPLHTMIGSNGVVYQKYEPYAETGLFLEKMRVSGERTSCNPSCNHFVA